MGLRQGTANNTARAIRLLLQPHLRICRLHHDPHPQRMSANGTGHTLYAKGEDFFHKATPVKRCLPAVFFDLHLTSLNLLY